MGWSAAFDFHQSGGISGERGGVPWNCIRIGYGDPKCFDRLNTLHFRIPVIGNDSPPERTDRIVLLIEPTTATGEEPAFYLENRSMPEDPVEDFYDFYAPLERALIARLQARN